MYIDISCELLYYKSTIKSLIERKRIIYILIFSIYNGLSTECIYSNVSDSTSYLYVKCYKDEALDNEVHKSKIECHNNVDRMKPKCISMRERNVLYNLSRELPSR